MKNLVGRATLAAALVFALTSNSEAQTIPIPGEDNTAIGTTSAEFLLLGAGARGAALGGAYSAIADDIEAMYWNPGGLALLEEGGITISSYDYIADTKYNWVGIAFPMSGGERVIGIQGASFGFSDQPVYTVDNPDGDGTTYSVNQSFIGLTYAQNFSDRFSAGVTAKFISDRLGRTDATAVAFDFGTNFHAMLGDKLIRTTFTISNLGTELKHTGSALEIETTRDPPLGQGNRAQDPVLARLTTTSFSLPTIFRVGLAYDFWNAPAGRLTLMSEFNQPNNNSASAAGGIEWALTDISGSGFSLVARGSYAYQPDNDITLTGAAFATTLDSDENKDGIALGGGIAYARGGFGLSFDYAYRHLGILGTANYFSVSVTY